MGAIAATVVGAGLLAGGTAMSASAAKSKRNRLSSAEDKWLPDIPAYQKEYFQDLEKYQPRAAALANQISEDDLSRIMRLREKTLPGINESSRSAMNSILPLLRGELPQGVLDAFNRSGAASSLGLGFGGSKFGVLNTGLFGARGALGAMQTGIGMLPTLLSTMPNIDIASSTDFLGSILDPTERLNNQMNIRSQNLAIESQLAGMQTSKDVWGGALSGMGGMLMGAGVTGMMGGAGGGGSSSFGPGGYFGGGAYGPTVRYNDPTKLKGAKRLWK